MVDVQVRLGIQAADDLVDGGLEGGLLAGLCHPALGVPAPEGMEQRPTVGTLLTRLKQSEEVVHAIFAGEGITLQVEVEVTVAGHRQRQQPLGRVELAVRRAMGFQQLVDVATLVLALHLDARLFVNALQHLRPRALQSGLKRQFQGAQRAASPDVTVHQRTPCAPSDIGHQREVVISPASLAADLIPAADAAVLVRLRI